MNEAFISLVKKDPAFAKLAEPVTADTKLVPSQYVMRKDGTYIFLETLNHDENGKEFIIGNPVRFPKRPGNPLVIGKDDNIFGLDIFNIMKILVDDKMSDSHHTQKKAIRDILASQTEGEWKIEPFKPTDLHIGSHFTRDEFLYHFPVGKTLTYNLEMKVPNIERAVVWAEKETGLTKAQLGLSGSSSLGIIDPEEDVDLCFIAPLAKLVEIKNIIHQGVLSGKFTPMEEYGHVWPLRCIIDGFELCPFFMPTDYEMDYAHITLHDEIEKIKVRVVNDDYNMLSPIMFKVEDESNKLHEMVITNGFNRGHFFKDDELELSNIHMGHIKTHKREFDSLIVKMWNSTRKL